MTTSPPLSLTPRRQRAWRHLRSGRTLVLASCVALVGCSLPTVDAPGGEQSAQESPIAAEPPDPSEAVVRAATADLLATVDAARAALTAAADAGSAAAARAEADTALAALVRDAGTGPPPATGPLFPDQTADRGSTADTDDQFTRTLTSARDAGAPGSALLDLLRDPIAGDIGSWQRDAAGVLGSIEATADGSVGLEQLEADIAELAGLGTRAVAWTLLATEATDGQLAVAYAERAAANLEVIALSLDRFVEGLGGGAGSPDDAATDAEDVLPDDPDDPQEDA